MIQKLEYRWRKWKDWKHYSHLGPIAKLLVLLGLKRNWGFEGWYAFDRQAFERDFPEANRKESR